jgi:hypothetical protein
LVKGVDKDSSWVEERMREVNEKRFKNKGEMNKTFFFEKVRENGDCWSGSNFPDRGEIL